MDNHHSEGPQPPPSAPLILRNCRDCVFFKGRWFKKHVNPPFCTNSDVNQRNLFFMAGAPQTHTHIARQNTALCGPEAKFFWSK